MRIEEFSARISSHGDLRPFGVRHADAVSGGDRLLVERRSDGALVAVPVRLVSGADWPLLEAALQGLAAHPGIGADAPDGAVPCAWTRSVIGLLKDRHVRAYSVETLIAR